MKNSIWISTFMSCCFLFINLNVSIGQAGVPNDPELIKSLSAVDADEAYNSTILAANGYIRVLFNDGSGGTDWIETPFNEVTGLLNYDDANLVIFEGDVYSLYSKSNQAFTEKTVWPGLPASWNHKLSASASWSKSEIVFINGLQYCTFNPSTQQYSSVQGLDRLSGWKSSWGSAVRAAWKTGGTLNLLIGSEIVPFDIASKSFAGERPKSSGIPTRNLSENSTGSPADATSMNPALNNTAVEGGPIAIGWNNYNPERDGRFRTDYPDYEKGSFTLDKAFSKNSKVPGYDWLGAGIDITKYDPIFPTNSWASSNSPIVTTLSPKTGGNRGTDVLPWGCNSRTISNGVGSFSSKWITSFSEFVQTFKIGGGAAVGVGKPGNQVAGANFSGSFSELMSDRIGSEVIYHVEKTNRTVFNLYMDLFWRDADNGMCRQRLSTAFEDVIAALPANPSTEQCNQVIQQFGTHIATGLTLGGTHLVMTEINKDNFVSTRMTETEFKAAASGQIKKVSVGANVEFKNTKSSTEGGSSESLERRTHASGGYGHEDKGKWADDLKDDPVAISITMVPLSQIMTATFFPNDKSISTKKTAMFSAINAYVKANTPPPIQSKDDFFDVEKQLAKGWDANNQVVERPGKIKLVNECHYDIKASITYELNGRKQYRNISSIMHKQKGERTIPAGATNIEVKVEWKELFTWRDLGTRTFPENGTFNLTSTGAFLQAPSLSE